MVNTTNNSTQDKIDKLQSLERNSKNECLSKYK